MNKLSPMILLLPKLIIPSVVLLSGSKLLNIIDNTNTNNSIKNNIIGVIFIL